jgi:penicillin-binding protein 2
LLQETQHAFKQIPVQKEHLDAVKEGMTYAANMWDGTAAYAFTNFPIKVAAKTGTSETSDTQAQMSSNSVFIAFAPADAPQIALAVVIERGVWGSNAAPVARDILSQYFGLGEKETPEEPEMPDEVRFIY